MFNELNKLIKNKDNSKISLVTALKDLSKTISIYDQMKVTNEIRENLIYIEGSLKESFFETYVNSIIRVNDVKNDKNIYLNECFDFKEFVKSILTLENQYYENQKNKEISEEFKKIGLITSLYTTFILDEPIHPTGTKFPGNLELTYKNGTYYCPVKENNKNNPYAVCQFCIAEQLDF